MPKWNANWEPPFCFTPNPCGQNHKAVKLMNLCCLRGPPSIPTISKNHQDSWQKIAVSSVIVAISSVIILQLWNLKTQRAVWKRFLVFHGWWDMSFSVPDQELVEQLNYKKLSHLVDFPPPTNLFLATTACFQSHLGPHGHTPTNHVRNLRSGERCRHARVLFWFVLLPQNGDWK